MAFRYSNESLSAAGSLQRGGRFNVGRDIDSGVIAPFPSLYIAENYPTAHAEFFGAGHHAPIGGFSGEEFALKDHSSFSAVKMSFRLSNVFDLTKVKNLEPFSSVVSKFQIPQELKSKGNSVGLSAPWLVRNATDLRKSFLASNWRYYPSQYGIPANSRIFGRLLRDAGFEAIIYQSTVGKGECVAVFIENFENSESIIELMDKSPDSVKHNRLDFENWHELSGL